MGNCNEHPDRETSYMCTKHGIYMCEECMTCRDPQLYCKFRTSCTIHFMGKKDIDGDVQHKEVVLPRRDTGKKNIDGSSPDE